VRGTVYVGSSPSPVVLSNNDLHSYVVVNDGRSYVAISDVPNSVGPSLQPLAALGGIIGWSFALEQPGFKNGFSIVGEGKMMKGDWNTQQTLFSLFCVDRSNALLLLFMPV